MLSRLHLYGELLPHWHLLGPNIMLICVYIALKQIIFGKTKHKRTRKGANDAQKINDFYLI